ncbi:MAG: ATP-binding cassette domain-containing protein [Alcaligenaceae bacterium]|nr:ATP-binding cassette domain-containing protein [Alcaligenaceae bacterium]
MLTLEQVSLSLMGEDIIEQVDLRVAPGEVACLYGPSGCGKTTLLRVIAGLIDYDSGRMRNHFTTLSYLFQEHRLLPWLSLWDNILLTAKDAKQSQVQEQAASILQRLHLQESDWQKYPKELSGGMRQRTALARALLNKPDLLLLDEPFSALDYELKLSIYDWIRELVENGMAIVMVTHDRFEALKLSHRIYLLKQKPASCRDMIEFDTPLNERDEVFIKNYLQQGYWQAYHE